MEILGVSVMIYCVFLLVVGILLFFYTIHGLNIEGFAGSSGSGSGSYMSPLSAVYVKDCTVVSTCVSIGKDTDRLTYLQRLPVEGKLISTNGRYVFKYMSTGMVILYDIGADSRGGSSNILWSSNTKGASLSVPAYLRNLGNIEAIATDGSTMPWIAVPKPDPMAGSGSGSGSSGSKPVYYAIPAIPNSGQYLQVTNYGDLVVMSPAGSIVWKANASMPPRTLDDPDACVPERMTYPFTTKDCYQLDIVLKKNNELLTSLITLGVSCKAGYYCPDNSTSNMENACPSGTYCPPNTKLPISCAAGYYCPPQSEMQNTCSTRGYYCPAGAISATQNACINMGVSVSTFAGSGTAGFADGTGPTASFNGLIDIVSDLSGNIYVSETSNHRIRKITPAGVVTTFAGSGTAGFFNGPAATARFDNPRGLAIDSAGSMYVAEPFSNTVRKITGGVVTTFATVNSPFGLVFNSSGTLYVSDLTTIYTVTPSGVVTPFTGTAGPGYVDGPIATAKFNGCYRMAFDSAGSLYVAESENRRIRKITGGVVTTLAGSGVDGYANGTGTAAMFSSPSGIAVDSQGNVYVSDGGTNQIIRKITPAGVVTTFAGTGIQGFSDSGAGNFSFPLGIVFDSEGNLYVVDRGNNRIRKIREDCNKVTGDPLACNARRGEYCSSGSLVPSPCTAGNICTPTGQTPCTGAVGTYCPAGATAPVSCTGIAAPGNYCPGGAQPISQCPAGSYCSGGTAGAIACSAGYYCLAGSSSPVQYPCTAGYYCLAGSSSPTQYACSAGYYCTAGSPSATQNTCTTAGYYCPAASPSATSYNCTAGNICTRTAQTPCTTPGYYCPAGATAEVVCTAGNICNRTGQTPCTGAIGTYCPAGATAPQPCAAPAGQYCPGGSSPFAACPAGYTCPGGAQIPYILNSCNGSDIFAAVWPAGPGRGVLYNKCSSGTSWYDPFTRYLY